MKISDLTRTEFDALTRVLRAPALWPFALLAGEVGFDAALDACKLNEVPEQAVSAFEACDYMGHDLPEHEDMLELIHATRLKLSWRKKREPLQTAARRLGLNVKQAQHALKTLAHYGAKAERLSALRSRSSS